VAEIQSVTVSDGFPTTFTTTSVASDGSEAQVQAAGGDTNDTGTVAVATVTVQTTGEGAVAIDRTKTEAGDEGGISYSLTDVSVATLTAAGDPAPANFAVSGLSPTDATITQGDNVTVSATVENTGGVSASQAVEFRAGSTLLGSQNVTLGGGASTTVEFTATDVGLLAGNYTHGIYTSDDNRTGTLTVEAASGLTVTLSSSSNEVLSGQTTTYDVVVANVSNGVGSGDLTVTSGNTSVAQVTAIEANSGFPSTFVTSNVSSDGSTANIRLAGGDTNDTGAVTVATVTVNGTAAGTSSLDLSVASLGDEAGNSLSVAATTGATVAVSEPSGAFVSDTPSSDGDGQFAGDGLHQDINGDGTVTFSDVTTLFQNLKTPEVQNNPNLFDFNGDGSVTFADMTTLFRALLP
jgi:hypothetical protein